MAKNTTNLNLYEKEGTDGSDTFNIQTMLNDNFDKIDTFAGNTNKNIDSLKSDNTDNKQKIASISTGISNSSTVFVQATDPATTTGITVKNNDVWIDSSNMITKIRVSNAWKSTGAIYL